MECKSNIVRVELLRFIPSWTCLSSSSVTWAGALFDNGLGDDDKAGGCTERSMKIINPAVQQVRGIQYERI